PPPRPGCDGVVDEVRLSRGLRPPDRLPDAPFRSDGRTLALWHFDRADPAATERADALLAELEAKEQELAAHPVPQVYAGVRGEPAPTAVFRRGDLRQPGAQVVAEGLSPVRSPSPDLGLSADAPEGQRRLRFAEWVVHADNPLPARVLVNRLWQYHFGQGLID